MALRNGPRLSRFVFTINNYDMEEFTGLCDTLAQYSKFAVVGREVGDSGTPHLQGAVVLQKQTAFSTVKRWMPRAHIEVMRGSPHDSFVYCTKEDRTAWTCGELPQPGKRSDLVDAVDDIKDGLTMMEMADKHGTIVVKYFKGLTVLRSLLATQRSPDNPIRFFWLCGPTGTGKTRDAWNYGCTNFGEAESLILPDSTLHWFDGYDGQKCVIVDDFRAKGVNFAWLLRLCDRYPIQVPFKGGFVKWGPEVIIITSPFGIRETFSKRAEFIPEDLHQLERRCTEVIQYDELISGSRLPGSDGITGSTSLSGSVQLAVPRRPALHRQDASMDLSAPLLRQCAHCTEIFDPKGTMQYKCKDCS